MQGFNMGRYVPPDVEGTTSGNQLHGKRPPGARTGGAQTVRFEMPFAVWCASCPQPTLIPQGARFNAAKRRAGAYHSTPIWAFRLRHAPCGGDVEIRTDPQNTAYVVAEGGAKRDTGDQNPPRDGDLAVLTDAERDALRRNAFASLERTIADREQLRHASDRLGDLAALSARHWHDPYARNQRLRRAFRAGRKERERDAAAEEDLRDRLGVGVDLLPASEQDAARAALVDFGADGGDAAGDRALSKPLFGGAADGRRSPPGRLKADREASRRKGNLASEVASNTRASHDPFLKGPRDGDAKPPARLPGVKRKRAAGDDDPQPPPKAAAAEEASGSSALVSYDSD